MSNESEILAVLSVLRQDASVRQSRLDQLKAVIRMYESELTKPESIVNSESNEQINPSSLLTNSGSAQPPVNSGVTVDEKDPKFPRNAHLLDQIPYVLQKRGIATKLPTLLDAINEALGGEAEITTHQIRGNTNKLLESGKLSRVKFNNTNTLVFYLLPDWIETNEEGGKELREEFKPTKQDLPIGVHKIEFV